MNIFVLHANPIIAAIQQCDKHIVKMPVETAQMLSTAVYFNSVLLQSKYPLHQLRQKDNNGKKLREQFRAETGLNLPTHENHPCSLWARESQENFQWLTVHGLALCTEYSERYHRDHASSQVINKATILGFTIDFPSIARTPFAQAMPEHFKHDNIEVAYRSYYLSDKHDIATWKCNKPEWWVDSWDEE